MNARSTRLYKPLSCRTITIDEKVFVSKKVIYADSLFFKVFDLKVNAGDKSNLLKEPNKIVLSKAASLRYFGSGNSVGKQLKYGNATYAVSGVFEDIPSNSHLSFDVILPLDPYILKWSDTNLHDNNFFTYVNSSEANVPSFKAQVNHALSKVIGYTDELNIKGNRCSIELIPISSINLSGNSEKEFEENGNLVVVSTIQVIGLFIMLMSGLNYVNLSTSRLINRGKEIGIRKILGSDRLLISVQFLMESVILALMSGIIATAGVCLLLPIINQHFSIAIFFCYFSSRLF